MALGGPCTGDLRAGGGGRKWHRHSWKGPGLQAACTSPLASIVVQVMAHQASEVLGFVDQHPNFWATSWQLHFWNPGVKGNGRHEGGS